jgi:hypothetical protein
MWERHRTSRARIDQLEEARRSITRLKVHVIENAMRFAFSILVCGGRFVQIEEVFLWNDVIPPAATSFYRAQSLLMKSISAKCERECSKWRNEMTPGSILSFDGSWSHRRGAKECVVVLIDTRIKKIVDFEILQKSKGKMPGNYTGSSNGMEVEALRRLILRWRTNPLVVGCVHDSDSKASKAIRDARWQIDQFYDPNHISKSFDRKWAKIPHAHLRGLQMKVRKWFSFLVRSDFSAQNKVAFWLNTVEHFLGNHEGCPHHKVNAQKRPPLADNQRGQEELRGFLERTTNLVMKCGHGLNTQMCESFNSVKARYADKTTSWKVSWNARTMCAILQMNNPERWKLELFIECNLEQLHDQTRQRLEERLIARREASGTRRTEEAQAKAQKRRARMRVESQGETAGKADYRFAAPRDSDGSFSQTEEDTESSGWQGLERWEEAKLRLEEPPEEKMANQSRSSPIRASDPSPRSHDAPRKKVTFSVFSLPHRHEVVPRPLDEPRPYNEMRPRMPSVLAAKLNESIAKAADDDEVTELTLWAPITSDSYVSTVELNNELVLEAKVDSSNSPTEPPRPRDFV